MINCYLALGEVIDCWWQTMASWPFFQFFIFCFRSVIFYVSISYLPRCESELIQRLLRGQGNVCLSSGARAVVSWSEIINLANVFAHKREFVAFQETLRANTSVPTNPRIFLPACHNAHDSCCVVLCCCFFFFRAHFGTQKSSLLLHQITCRCLLIGWESLGGFLLISIRFNIILKLAKMYTEYILNIFWRS